MSFHAWKPYVPVAKRRQQAAKELAKLLKAQKGGKTGTQNGTKTAAPVIITGRAIATSFWGKSWCSNLERYSDYANRLPRGRTYARNGSVIDLQIATGEIVARVSGSYLYTVRIGIAPVAPQRWTAICRDCAGSIDSVVELLQGRLAKAVMDRVCQPGDGLFPAPTEIKLSCSCPDGASMCKHVAAALYGVGARLDQRPELLFGLRGVDERDLIASVGTANNLGAAPTAAPAKVLNHANLAGLFGLDMAEGPAAAAPAAIAKARQPAKAAKPKAKAAATRTPAALPRSKAAKAKATRAPATPPPRTGRKAARKPAPAKRKA